MKYELRTTILALVPSILALAVAACSSDDSTKPKAPTTTGGGSTSSTSSGTTSAGTGSGTTTSGSGTTTAGAGSTTTTSTTAGAGGAPTTTTAAGSGGSATGAGGATGGAGGAGTGGAGGAGGCPAPTTATGLISDFATMNVANQLTSTSTDVWFVPAGATRMATVTGGVMHFIAPGAVGGTTVSTLIASRPATIDCVDLSARYTSISFKISSPTSTSLLFQIYSKEVAMMPDGSGFRTSFMVTPTLTTQTIMLSTLQAPGFGLGSMQASMPGFNILKDAAAIGISEAMDNKDLDIMLDDVQFQ